MKKLTTISVLGLGLVLSPLGHSDTFFGIYAGGGSIDYDISGDFTDLDQPSTGSVDLEQDLGLEGERGNYFYIALEHGIPLLPNVRLAHSDIQESAFNTLSNTISLGGAVFPAGAQLATDIDFSPTDLTFYYEILDNWVNLDIGLTVRKFDGKLEAVGRYSILPAHPTHLSPNTTHPLTNPPRSHPPTYPSAQPTHSYTATPTPPTHPSTPHAHSPTPNTHTHSLTH